MEFPLGYFTRVLTQKGQYFRCHYPDPKPELTCSKVCDTFEEAINHYRHDHDMAFLSGIDYCLTCERMFLNKGDAIAHYLAHLVSLETTTDSSIRLDPKETWYADGIKDIFIALKEVQKKTLDLILFKEIEESEAQLKEDDLFFDMDVEDSQ